MAGEIRRRAGRTVDLDMAALSYPPTPTHSPDYEYSHRVDFDSAHAEVMSQPVTRLSSFGLMLTTPRLFKHAHPLLCRSHLVEMYTNDERYGHARGDLQPGPRMPFPSPPTSHQPAYPPPWVYEQSPFPGTQHFSENAQAGPSRSKGRDFLLSLGTDMANLNLIDDSPRQRITSSASIHKPLPRLPPPPLPSRPYSTDAAESYSSTTAQSALEAGTIMGVQTGLKNRCAEQSHTMHSPGRLPQTPPKSFRPSSELASPSKLRPPYTEPRLARPYSDPAVSHAIPPNRRKEAQPVRAPSIIVVESDSDTNSSSSSIPAYITTRSPARNKRATSEIPSRPSRPSRQSKGKEGTPSRSIGTGSAVRCAGFTRKGAPCQRLVKAEAPYLAMLDPNLETEDRVQARYCKDHAGMICNAKGFYWKSGKEATGIWVEFEEFIPSGLGQQTQALLRMTMESPLTEKEAPGFLYAYELRDLQNSTSSFFKVGRTDNVPRRIGEWTTRCRSHSPTLRDIFPLPSAPISTSSTHALSRTPTLPTSYLPGAFRQTTNPQRTCPAVKRWERLVHLELADLANTHAPHDYANLKEKCEECQAVHREIFSLGNGERVYEERVMEVVCRWERFIRKTNLE